MSKISPVAAGTFSTLHVRLTFTDIDSLPSDPAASFSELENYDLWFAPSIGNYIKTTVLLTEDGQQEPSNPRMRSSPISHTNRISNYLLMKHYRIFPALLLIVAFLPPAIKAQKPRSMVASAENVAALLVCGRSRIRARSTFADTEQPLLG